MKYILPRGYLSASAIGMLHKCAKQFEFRYVENRIMPPEVAQLTGQAVHSGFETYYMDRLSSRHPLTPAMVAEFSVGEFEAKAKADGVRLKGEEKDQAVREIAVAAESYVEHVGQFIMPRSVEQEVRYTSACGVDILMYLDLISEPQDDFGPFSLGVIRDYKVTGKRWSGADLRNSLQFMLYSLGTGYGDVEIQNLLRTADKARVNKIVTNPKDPAVLDPTSNIRLIRHHFDGSEAAHVEAIIEASARQITAGVFPPCDPASWACTPKWCGYWSICRGAGRGSTLTVDMGRALS